ncbi:DUF1206 domain-containing protein [Microbacterium sp. MC2]
MRDAAKRTARTAERSPVMRVLARGGYAANGAVHVLIGVIVLVIAFGGRGESDQAGAFKAIAAAPAGAIALWALAVMLAGLGVWHALDGLLVARSSSAQKWGVRVSRWGQAVVFLALGAIAASVALGARPDAEETAEQASRGALALPGGVVVLLLVGAGITIGGVAFVVMGVRRSFRDKMILPEGRLGDAVVVLGLIGFVAKGIALLIVGILLIVAAVRVDPEAAGGLDGAITALRGMFLGPLAVASVGIGLIAYGVFCFFRARFAWLDAP